MCLSRFDQALHHLHHLHRLHRLGRFDPPVPVPVGDHAQPHLLTAEIQPVDTVSGLRLRQLLAELRERIAQAIPRVAVVSLMPVWRNFFLGQERRTGLLRSLDVQTMRATTKEELF